jgi:antirestriction protein ArdC
LNCPIIDDQGSFKEAWIETLKEDKYLLVKAGTLAQRAVDYIIGDGGKTEVPQPEQTSFPITNEKPEKKSARKRQSSK